MNILVTGANGFVGGHAIRELLSRGHSVFATDTAPGAAPSLPAGIPYRPADIRQPADIDALLDAARPDAILHLGGIAFVPVAWEDPALVFHVNTIGPLHLLAAVRRKNPAIRMLLVTSAEVYGIHAPSPVSLDESAPYAPENLYGVTKAAADHGAMLYAAHHGLDLMVARPSNHIGPGQSAPFVTTAFARQLKDIAVRGAPNRMNVGNLDALRDFTDVRDTVRAYALLLEKGHARTAYNIATGQLVTIRSILDRLCEIAGVRPDIQVDAALFRPDPPRPVLSPALLREHTGWTPKIPLADTLRDIYDALP